MEGMPGVNQAQEKAAEMSIEEMQKAGPIRSDLIWWAQKRYEKGSFTYRGNVALREGVSDAEAIAAYERLKTAWDRKLAFTERIKLLDERGDKDGLFDAIGEAFTHDKEIFYPAFAAFQELWIETEQAQ